MRSAPSVDYPVGRSFWGGVFLLTSWLAGGAALLGWLIQAPIGWRQVCGAALHAAVGIAALRSWLNSGAGQLAWDGRRWLLQKDGKAEGPDLRLDVVFDFQKVLLLRGVAAAASARPCWFWMEHASAPARWLALRRAVYSPAAAGSLPQGEPTDDS